MTKSNLQATFTDQGQLNQVTKLEANKLLAFNIESGVTYDINAGPGIQDEGSGWTWSQGGAKTGPKGNNTIMVSFPGLPGAPLCEKAPVGALIAAVVPVGAKEALFTIDLVNNLVANAQAVKLLLGNSFPVGEGLQVRAPFAGCLVLFMNDGLLDPSGDHPGYADNSGYIQVQVISN